MEEKEIGLIGLGVMGASLCLNLASKGYSVLAYNRNQEKARKFMDSRAVGLPIARASTLQELVKGVRRPRKILLMVSAGSPVDAVMQELLPMMEPGDILIDGGNSFYQDTERRGETAGKHGILYDGSPLWAVFDAGRRQRRLGGAEASIDCHCSQGGGRQSMLRLDRSAGSRTLCQNGS